MKNVNAKFLKWISLSVLLIFYGCSDGQNLDLDTIGKPIKVSFSASMSAEMTTKTSYDATRRLGLWKREDMVGVIAEYGSNSFTDTRMQEFCIDSRCYVGGEFLSNATFSGNLTDKGNQTYTYYAVYPYTAFQTVTDASSVLSRLEERQYPDLKSWDGACDMLAAKPVTVTSSSVAADNLQLQFTRLFGMLRLRFGTSITDTYGSEIVETISIESSEATDKLAGKFTVNLAAIDALDPVMSATTGEFFNKVTLDYRGWNSSLSNIDAYFIINPGTFENVTIKVKTKNHTLTLPRTNLTVTRGSVAAATMSWKGGDTAVESTPLLPKNPETLKVLTFGHSFGNDSMDYIDDLLTAAKITNVTFANLVIGNASLNTYWAHARNEENIKGGSDTITFYKRYYNGASITTDKSTKTIIDALSDEPWDVIVFQTDVYHMGYYDNFAPALQKMIEYVKTTCQSEHGKTPILAWHMFWAMGSHSVRLVQYYFGDQELNYTAHVQAAKMIIRNKDIQIVIPTGTTIQSLRHSKLNNPYKGDEVYEFLRDGLGTSHLDIAGRYSAACTWFESFLKPCFGISVLGNTFTPSTSSPGVKVTAENRESFQRAAIRACQNPFEISHLDEYTVEVTGSTEVYQDQEKGSIEAFSIIDNLTW